MHARLAYLIALVVVLTGATAHAEEPEALPVPRVAVVIELAVNVEPERADEVGAALADALNRELEVDAVGGADVTRQLPADGLAEECLAKPDCIGDVASRLDADQLLFLAVVQVGDDIQVDASFVDVTTGKVTSRPRVVLSAGGVTSLVFSGHAQRYLPDARKRGTRVVVNTNPVVIETPRHMTTPSWITAGVAVAALGAGTVLGLSARSIYKDCERTPCDDDRLDSQARRALLADVSFAVAAGAAVATAILFFRSSSTSLEQPRPTGVGVTPTEGGAILGIAGHF